MAVLSDIKLHAFLVITMVSSTMHSWNLFSKFIIQSFRLSLRQLFQATRKAKIATSFPLPSLYIPLQFSHPLSCYWEAEISPPCSHIPSRQFCSSSPFSSPPSPPPSSSSFYLRLLLLKYDISFFSSLFFLFSWLSTVPLTICTST